MYRHIVASELKDPISHYDECQIGSFSSEATLYHYSYLKYQRKTWLNFHGQPHIIITINNVNT